MKQKLTSIIDVFYPPFRRLMPIETFRYAACGGANTVLGLLLYSFAFHNVFTRENVYLDVIVLKPHNAALFLAFCVTFIVGFLLNKYVVFTTSNLRGRIQLFRYFLSVFINLIINYFLLKFFVEFCHWEAVFSQVLTTVIIIAISYLTQKHFSFR